MATNLNEEPKSPAPRLRGVGVGPGLTAAVLALTATFAATAAAAQTTVLFRQGSSPTPAYAGVKDLLITDEWDSGASPDTSYGGTTVSLDGFPAERRVLLRFDLGATIPSTATVQSVVLQLTLATGGSQPYFIYECLRPWSETEATWNRPRASETWGTPGADSIGVDRGSTVLGQVSGAVGAQSFTLNASGVAAVQRWVSGTATNEGFVILNAADEIWDGVALQTSDHGTATVHPKLTVTYDAGTVATFQDGVSPSAVYAGTADVGIAWGPAEGWANGAPFMLSLGSDAFHQEALLSFDLSSIPSNAAVTGASLLVTNADASPGDFPIYEVLRPWNESSTCWASYDGTNLWEVPGGKGTSDRGTAVLGTLSAPPAGLVTVPLAAAGIDAVQAWVSGARPNYGFYVDDGDSADTAGLRTSEDSTAADRPGLQVTYAFPAVFAPLVAATFACDTPGQYPASGSLIVAGDTPVTVAVVSLDGAAPPAALVYDTGSGALRWTPTAGDVGLHQVEVSAYAQSAGTRTGCARAQATSAL